MPSKVKSIDLTPMAQLARQTFRGGWRGAAEFLVVALVLTTADPTPRSLLVGGIVTLLGELLRIITAGYGLKLGELSVRGPYRFMRHPYFVGTALAYLGLCLAGRNPYAMATALLVMTMTFRFVSHKDEARLEARLGPEFQTYRARVPAFLPRLVPESKHIDKSADARGFSLRLSLLTGRHRELDAALGFICTYGLLYLCYRTSAKDLFHLVVMITLALYLIGRFVYVGYYRRAAG